MSALEELDTDQRDKYQQFLDFTNWEGDPVLPLILLRSAHWNVEVCIFHQLFLSLNSVLVNNLLDGNFIAF